jgi:tetratricopeptide (TPR) repeat protein
MLTTNIPSLPPIENNINFTLDDFLQFYRSVASPSYQRSSMHHNALTLVREKLFRYASSLISADVSSVNFTAIHRKILAEQISTLLQKNIIVSDLDLKKQTAIVQDILRNGEIFKAIISLDDEDSLLGCLTNINDECQAREPVVNTVPAHLKTGVSKTEQNTIVYGANNFPSLPAVMLCNKGLEKLKLNEWQNAVEYFQQSIATENQIAEECHLSPNISNISICNRNIVYAFHMAGFSLQQAQNYSDSIAAYNKALVATQAISKNLRNTQDTDTCACCHRDIAICENYFANSLFNTDQISEAIIHYKLAISELDKIPDAVHNDFDSGNVSIYKRNLAFALNKKGHQFFEQKNFVEAATHYESARIMIAGIKPEWRQENDSAVECIYQDNKELARANNDDNKTANNRNVFFKKSVISPSAPVVSSEEPERKKRKLG